MGMFMTLRFLYFWIFAKPRYEKKIQSYICNPEAIHLASVLLIGSLFAQSLVRPRVKSQEGCVRFHPWPHPHNSVTPGGGSPPTLRTTAV